MNETLKKIGQELRRRYEGVLRSPLNWRMIDAISHLEEIEEDKSKADPGAPQKPDQRDVETDRDRTASSEHEPQQAGKVVDLSNRKRQA